MRITIPNVNNLIVLAALSFVCSHIGRVYVKVLCNYIRWIRPRTPEMMIDAPLGVFVYLARSLLPVNSPDGW
jgi:hypothetical protein